MFLSHDISRRYHIWGSSMSASTFSSGRLHCEVLAIMAGVVMLFSSMFLLSLHLRLAYCSSENECRSHEMTRNHDHQANLSILLLGPKLVDCESCVSRCIMLLAANPLT